MNSAVEFWQHAENTFWGWWGPVLLMCTCGLFYMSRLQAAETFSGKVARIFLLVGFFCMVAAFFYSMFGNAHNGVTRMGMLLIMAGTVLVIRQFALACAQVRKQTPSDSRFGKRVLAVLVDHR